MDSLPEETRLMEVEGIAALVTRKRVRTLRLAIHPPAGEVRVSAPRRTSFAEIARFVASKAVWIRKHQAAMRERAAVAPPPLGEGETVPLWGVSLRLIVEEGPGRLRIEAAPGELRLRLPPGSPGARRSELVQRFYRRELEAALPPLLAEWTEKVGMTPTGLSLRNMKSRWGSCSARARTIRLSTELARLPRTCLEYVLVHELVHLIEASHSKRFWRIVERHLPDWRARRAALSPKNHPSPEDSSSTSSA